MERRLKEMLAILSDTDRTALLKALVRDEQIRPVTAERLLRETSSIRVVTDSQPVG